MRSTPPAISVLVAAALLAAGCGGGGGEKKPPPQAPVADAPKASTPAPRKVVLVVDGKRTETMTTGTTVQEVLTQAQVQLGKHNLVKPPLTAPAAGTKMIKVLRLLSKPVTKTLTTSAPTIKKKSSKLPPFSEKVLRKGKPGIKVVQVAWVKRRGKKVKTVIDQKVKRKPVAEILAVGPQSAGAGSAARLNWAGLAKCESGGNPRAVNSAGGYYGLYQFSLATWGSVGGKGLPSNATPAEQTYRAQMLYNKVNGRWQGQWPVCGKFLFS
ncbi:transglycosylase family protein [Spirillospora sp. NPDC048911]|uniref:transglycosylase family protein n=1 Tax=Spirillospora sp. NPDC048911 TaxID=3364527 RepID=UPI0037159761